MPLPLFIVDAFASNPFTGNPAAVCLLDRERDDAWLQAFAGEMNLSETAYVLPRADGWSLRWFTPLVEVELCGHATLATSHVLWETGRLQCDAPAIFHTRSGKLVCRREDQWIAMDFPAEPPHEVEWMADLIDGLGVRPLFVGRNRMDVIACLDSEQAVRDVVANQTALGRIKCRASSSPLDRRGHTTSCRVRSFRVAGCRKIPCADRPTAALAHSGRNGWERANWLGTRCRSAVGLFACNVMANA